MRSADAPTLRAAAEVLRRDAEMMRRRFQSEADYDAADPIATLEAQRRLAGALEAAADVPAAQRGAALRDTVSADDLALMEWLAASLVGLSRLTDPAGLPARSEAAARLNDARSVIRSARGRAP